MRTDRYDLHITHSFHDKEAIQVNRQAVNRAVTNFILKMT